MKISVLPCHQERWVCDRIRTDANMTLFNKLDSLHRNEQNHKTIEKLSTSTTINRNRKSTVEFSKRGFKPPVQVTKPPTRGRTQNKREKKSPNHNSENKGGWGGRGREITENQERLTALTLSAIFATHITTANLLLQKAETVNLFSTSLNLAVELRTPMS